MAIGRRLFLSALAVLVRSLSARMPVSTANVMCTGGSFAKMESPPAGRQHLDGKGTAVVVDPMVVNGAIVDTTAFRRRIDHGG